jgi:hypothetical protein
LFCWRGSRTLGNALSRDAPDIVLPDIRLIKKLDTRYPAGYPVRARYRTWLDNHIFGEVSNKFSKIALKIIDFFKL